MEKQRSWKPTVKGVILHIYINQEKTYLRLESSVGIGGGGQRRGSIGGSTLFTYLSNQGIFVKIKEEHRTYKIFHCFLLFRPWTLHRKQSACMT